MNDPMYGMIGDIVHLISLASGLGFAVLVANLAKNESDSFFDPLWKKDGFCITNPNVPYWTS